MQNGLLDDPALIAGAAADAGLDPDELERWCATDQVERALQEPQLFGQDCFAPSVYGAGDLTQKHRGGQTDYPLVLGVE